ncbi:HEAT repeat domain-containing protein, partial [bacterium]|nr:HEAT repeat domain-containing protein [candidate division CSSED10-310 bacterium]
GSGPGVGAGAGGAGAGVGVAGAGGPGGPAAAIESKPGIGKGIGTGLGPGKGPGMGRGPGPGTGAGLGTGKGPGTGTGAGTGVGLGPGLGPGKGGQPGLGGRGLGTGAGVETGRGLAGGTGRKSQPELMLLNEIVARVSGGESLQTFSSEEIGSLFKRILSGEIDKDVQLKKTLAELIISLDPEFMEKAIVEYPEIRERLSWVVIRRIIDRVIIKLKSDKLAVRMGALEILGQVGQLAVVRSKNSSTRQIIGVLVDKLLKEEIDEDMVFRISDVLSSMICTLIEYNNLILVQSTLQTFRTAHEDLEKAEFSERSELLRAALERLFDRISKTRTVEFLVRQMQDSKRAVAERAIEIINMVQTEEVVLQLLKVFETASRKNRSRTFNMLVKMPEISSKTLIWVLDMLYDTEMFPRQEVNRSILMDEAWYRARNALGVLAHTWHEEAARVFYAVSRDPDPRIRKEVVNVLLHNGRDTVGVIARGMIHDKDNEVRSYAMLALRSPEGTDSVRDLIQIFIEEPALRESVIETLASIGSERAEEFVLDSLYLENLQFKRIFFKDFALYRSVIRAVARFGTEKEVKALERIRSRFRNPLGYVYFHPFFWVFKAPKVLTAINESILSIEQRMKDTGGRFIKTEIPVGVSSDPFAQGELQD